MKNPTWPSLATTIFNINQVEWKLLKNNKILFELYMGKLQCLSEDIKIKW